KKIEYNQVNYISHIFSNNNYTDWPFVDIQKLFLKCDSSIKKQTYLYNQLTKLIHPNPFRNLSIPYSRTSDIKIQKKIFCITGRFKLGPRSEVIHRIKSSGGLIHDDIIKKVDYLVVGEYGSQN